MIIVDVNKLIVPKHRQLPSALQNAPALRKSMAKKGQLSPILITDQYEIIDGVRRLIEAQALGWPEIQAVIPANYDEACEHMHDARSIEPATAQEITPLRVYQIIQSLHPLDLQRRRDRTNMMKGRPLRSPYRHLFSNAGPVRKVLAHALGLAGEGQVQVIKRLFTTADAPGPKQTLAKQLVADVVSKKLTLYAAYGRLRRAYIKENMVTDAGDQRTMLTGMVPVADALISSMNPIGDIAEEITGEEARIWAAKLRQARGAMFRVQVKLQRKADKETQK